MLERQPWRRSEKKELPEKDACGVSSANYVAAKQEAKQSVRREVAGCQIWLIIFLFFLSPHRQGYKFSS